METRIQKWGNSLAVRIPKAFAEETALKEDSTVEIVLRNGKLIIAPSRRPKITLEQLLNKVTSENLHSEVETGEPKGNEAW
jgi:antitoxin MazE